MQNKTVSLMSGSLDHDKTAILYNKEMSSPKVSQMQTTKWLGHSKVPSYK